MSIEAISALMALSFVGLLVLGLPLAFAAGAIAVIFALALYGPPGLVLVSSLPFRSLPPRLFCARSQKTWTRL